MYDLALFFVFLSHLTYVLSIISSGMMILVKKEVSNVSFLVIIVVMRMMIYLYYLGTFL